MAKSFNRLRAKMPSAARARAQQKARRIATQLSLSELRTARQMSQEHVATRLGINQAAVSKIERRTDLYLSTLRRFIEAMGGKLEITARFPQGAVRISRIGCLGE